MFALQVGDGRKWSEGWTADGSDNKAWMQIESDADETACCWTLIDEDADETYRNLSDGMTEGRRGREQRFDLQKAGWKDKKQGLMEEAEDRCLREGG